MIGAFPSSREGAPVLRKVYIGLTSLLLAAVVVQFYFAAVGAFAKPQQDNSFALHEFTGSVVIPLLAILATVAAALLRLPGRQIGLTAAVLGLVVVQLLIVVIGHALSDNDGQNTTPLALIVLGLHGINGLAIIGIAGGVFARARRLPASPVTVS
jgi:uncharacterized membrane protein